MNEMDLLTEFRAEVPLGVSPHAEELFRAGLKDHSDERARLPRTRTTLARRPFARRPFARIGMRWRLALAAGLAAGLALGVLAAVQPSGQRPGQPAGQPSAQAIGQPSVLTARMLADRAAAAALTGPTVPAGKWVYQRTVTYSASPPRGIPARLTQDIWSTADGSLEYQGGGWSRNAVQPALYRELSSLPANPVAIDRYLARLSYPNANATRTNDEVAAFTTIEQLLSSAILPPSLNAELYRALGDIPTVEVRSHVTDIDGRAGVAFVLPENSQSANQEIILDAKDYGYLAQAAWQPSNGTPNSAIPFTETAVLHTTLVYGPGRTAADPAPPSQAVLAAEQAAIAVLAAGNPGQGTALTDPGQWIYRKLAVAGGTSEVWARVDDTSQASYVHGRLVTCARSASCASGATWLMPAGPAYPVVYPSGAAARNPQLPDDPQALLDKLNTYPVGCADTAADCNAVSVFAHLLVGYGNTLLGYGNIGVSPLTWYFSLADVPGVTIKHVTDAAGRADVEFSFPLTSGVTAILYNARTYQFAGYLDNGAVTLLLQQANVAAPGVRP
jgi:hypothetical protein